MRDYILPLGLDSRSFASHIGAEAAVLDAMLAGRLSIDAEMAVRISRALQLSADRIMQMQLRSDFWKARETPALQRIGPLAAPAVASFPESHLNGRLCRGDRSIGSSGAYFFIEDVKRRDERDHYAGIHALWLGDRLRIFESSDVVWSGPILEDFDGAILLPYVTSETWRKWFATSCRADLAPGAEHTAQLSNAR